jgi:hypothetical protein
MGVTTLDPKRDALVNGIQALAAEFPGWNFGVRRVLPGWEAEAVHAATKARVKVHAAGSITALAMAEGAVKAVNL